MLSMSLPTYLELDLGEHLLHRVDLLPHDAIEPREVIRPLALGQGLLDLGLHAREALDSALEGRLLARSEVGVLRLDRDEPLAELRVAVGQDLPGAATVKPLDFLHG